MNRQRATLLVLVLGVIPILGGCSTWCCDNVSDAAYDHERDINSSWCRKCSCVWPPEGKSLDEGEVALTPTWNRIFGCGDQCSNYYHTRGPADCLCGRRGGGRMSEGGR